jgi:hypothetical protein
MLYSADIPVVTVKGLEEKLDELLMLTLAEAFRERNPKIGSKSYLVAENFVAVTTVLRAKSVGIDAEMRVTFDPEKEEEANKLVESYLAQYAL